MSIISGEKLKWDRSVPVSWAALAGIVQLVVLLVPSMVWAGTMNTRLGELEAYRALHQSETVRRIEFEKVEVSTVKQDEFRQFSLRVLERLDRIERKIDSK